MQKLVVYTTSLLISIVLPFFVFGYTGIDGFQFILILFFAVIISVLLGLVVYELLKNKVDNAGFISVPVCLIAIVVLCNMLNTHFDNLEYAYYKKYGVQTVGTIANGVQISGGARRNQGSFLSINFMTADSTLVYTSANTNAFSSHFVDEDILVIYCKNEPKRVKVFETKEDMEVFMKKVMEIGK